jgi:predicted nucleotidyltransferase component of viral defense system
MQYVTTGLTPDLFDVLKTIGKCIYPWGYYLAGGTALSVYFGHRRSVDLDWFTPSKLSDPLGLAQNLRDTGLQFETDTFELGSLHGSIKGVRSSFLEYHYSLLQPLNYWPEGNCNLASLDDLACMKLAAVTQRGSRKDFVDIYELAQRHKPLSDLLGLFQKKYEMENLAPVLMGLVYFEDAERETDPFMWSGNWQEVKRVISDWVRRI